MVAPWLGEKAGTTVEPSGQFEEPLSSPARTQARLSSAEQPPLVPPLQTSVHPVSDLLAALAVAWAEAPAVSPTSTSQSLDHHCLLLPTNQPFFPKAFLLPSDLVFQ